MRDYASRDVATAAYLAAGEEPFEPRVEVDEFREDPPQRGRVRRVGQWCCGWWSAHPVCVMCGRKHREPASDVERAWMRNNGFGD